MKMLFCILIQEPFVFRILKAPGAADLNVGMLRTMAWNTSDGANTPSSTAFHWRINRELLPRLPVLLSLSSWFLPPPCTKKVKTSDVRKGLEKQWISDILRSKTWFLILEYLVVLNQDTISEEESKLIFIKILLFINWKKKVWVDLYSSARVSEINASQNGIIMYTYFIIWWF